MALFLFPNKKASAEAAASAGAPGRDGGSPGSAWASAAPAGGWESKGGERRRSLEESCFPLPGLAWQQPPSRLQLGMDYSCLAHRLS